MSDQLYQMRCQDGVILVTFEKGIKINPECILEVIDKKNKLYDVQRLNSLWDFRGALPSDNFGYDAIERIIHHIDNHPEAHWSPHLAILADAGVQYGLSRMFQTLTNQFPVEIQIFNSEMDAKAWVVEKAVIAGSEDGVQGQ